VDPRLGGSIYRTLPLAGSAECTRPRAIARARLRGMLRARPRARPRARARLIARLIGRP
jgi:hypothetical protein